MKNYLDEKVKKNAYDVILRLNYKAQLFLLAVYDLMGEKNDVMTFKSIQTKFFEILCTLKFELSESVTEIVDLLKVYHLIEIQKRERKQNKIQLVQCKVPRDDLKKVLSQVDFLKVFFDDDHKKSD